MKQSILISVMASFFGLVTSANATPILTLGSSSVVVTGLAGSTVGWGFALSNSSDYVVVSSSNFCLGTSGVTSLCLAPTIGTYADEIASNFIIVGPSPESPLITQSFSSTLDTGLGSFAIKSGEPDGATNAGQLVLTYDLYDVDPNSATFDPTNDLVSAGNFLTATAIVQVKSATPEPASGWYMALVGGGLILWGRRKTSKSAE